MRKLDLNNFLERAKKVHNNKYDYSKVDYKNNSTKVCIICPEHGEFWQTPNSHLAGHGCPFCSYNVKKNKEQFIKDSRKIHGEKYDYSKVDYKNAKSKVCIICPEHGEFWQKPNSHLNGCGCPKCGYENAFSKNRKKVKDFIKKAKEIHGGKYDYSKVEYKNNKTKVCIICPEHGEFWQTPDSHLRGSGCKLCGYKKMSEEKLFSTEEWIRRAKQVHGDRYDYSLVNYTGYYNKIKVICKKHGIFEQIAYDHLQGKGCRKCKKSKLEIEISNFLDEKRINYIEQIRPKYLSCGKSHLSLDFYLPDYNIAIECQGEQHFVDKTFFDKRKETIKERDIRKYNLCKNNVTLLYFAVKEHNNYIDYVYTDKEKLLKRIYNEKLL